MTLIAPKFYVAVDAISYIALHSGAHAVRSKDIAAELGLKLRYLEHILQPMVHHGLLKSTRGPKGGYVLAKDRRTTTLADIYAVMLAVSNDDAESEQPQHACHPHLAPMIERTLSKALLEQDLQSLCETMQQAKATPRGVKNTANKNDFVI